VSLRPTLVLCNPARLGLQNGEWQTNRSLADLTEETREILEEELERRIAGATLFQRENPLVRHVVAQAPAT
jgi:hypothetical protein